MSRHVIAACDGACKGNPGPAAWAFVIADADGTVRLWRSGALGQATNNIAELTALEQLLAELDPGDSAEIRMDSQYAMKAVTEWLPGWKKKGWKTAAGKPVANQDLVRRIDELLSARKVVLKYVAAHQVGGDALNDLADRAASAAAVAQRGAEGTSATEVPASSAAGSVPARAAGGSRPGNSAGTRGRSGSSGAAGSGAAGSGARSAPVISAKFAGRCACGASYAAGEKLMKGASGWGHPGCVKSGVV
jgi:ribonuclease HI